MNSQYLQKKKLPDSPGVYFFLAKNKKPIYIGKATSLKDRVKSYFSKDLPQTRGPLLVKMLQEAHAIEVTETSSVLEALLLEADLIKKFRPLYNTKEKDDKSFNCVVITAEDFPQIRIIRKKDINFDELTTLNLKLKTTFGPFPHGLELKEALKIIRRIFPYRDDKCYPKGSLKNKNGKPCFSRQIGLCPGVCTGEISRKEYAKTIKHLETFFAGRTKRLIADLKKEMAAFAKEQDFECASITRNKIYALEHINDISLIKSSASASFSSSSFRIEAYDVAHLSGQNMVGVAVTIADGIPDKSSYKKFNIKSVSGSNDVGALKEILTRRFSHTEWQFPHLVVVDGSTAQINAAKEILKQSNISIPIIAVVKDERHKARALMGDEVLSSRYKKAIILANSEAHRFAIAFHKKKRTKNFLPLDS